MSKETLNSETAYQLLIKDIITTEADFKEDKNRWILHCIYSGIAAGKIADKLGLDSDYAKALGYIHDIGRRISHPKHPIEGFNYMKELGYEETAYQENKRISYVLDDIELDIDSWPLIPTYLEIEGKSEESVKKYIELLGLQDYEITSEGVTKVYARYNVDLDSYKELKFEEG